MIGNLTLHLMSYLHAFVAELMLHLMSKNRVKDRFRTENIKEMVKGSSLWEQK